MNRANEMIEEVVELEQNKIRMESSGQKIDKLDYKGDSLYISKRRHN